MAFYLDETSLHFCKMAILDNKNRLTNLFTQSVCDRNSTHVMVGSNTGKAANSTQRSTQVACTFYTTSLLTSMCVRRQQTHKLSIKKSFLLPSSICHYADVICSRTIGKFPSPTFIKFVAHSMVCRRRYVVKHNLITGVYLMIVMETITCFGLCWPSSGCLGNLRASYMHARARGVEISTHA